jgi:hypothetical protein
MADRNGNGIVYHRSDCSSGYVRFYGFGGDGPCSKCDKWGVADWLIDIIHENDHNFRAEDLNKAERILRLMIGGLNEDEWKSLDSYPCGVVIDGIEYCPQCDRRNC